MRDCKAQVVEFSGTLALDSIGFSAIDLDSRYQRAFQQWIGNGYHADMDYLSRRLQEGDIVRSRVPEAQSLITVAINYHREETFIPGIRTGQVSRYAVGRDYHNVMGKKLKKLCRFIQEELQGSARYYVDTGPFMERAYGETSTVGYIGKNSMLISQELGSWFFLGVVITSLKLALDKKRLLIRCGDCTRCMAACPTGAIVTDGVVDSNRCISYLTIENRGAIPTHLRKAIGDRIFGCDTCQEVCPHNVRARVCREEDFKRMRFANRRISLQEILELGTDEVFTQRFRGTPIMRAKRRGLQRNACIAAGNSNNPALIPVLKKFIVSTTDAMLIEHANWAVAELERR